VFPVRYELRFYMLFKRNSAFREEIYRSHYQVATETNYCALTRCMNVNYKVGHERASSLLLQCVR
jgi:hypothetical protein